MKDYSSKLLNKALDAIEAAEALLNIDKAEFAAGRAYIPCSILPMLCCITNST